MSDFNPGDLVQWEISVAGSEPIVLVGKVKFINRKHEFAVIDTDEHVSGRVCGLSRLTKLAAFGFSPQTERDSQVVSGGEKPKPAAGAALVARQDGHDAA